MDGIAFLGRSMSCIINYLKKLYSGDTTFCLTILSAFSVFLTLVRVIISGHALYLFLVKNLILAIIPWFVSTIIYFGENKKGFRLHVLVFLWIIFFPNSFYLMTDIIHLGKGIRTAPVWFDAISLLSYGICGLLFGIVSLKMMEEKACELIGRKKSAVVRVVFIYVSCFGIFLGRFLRWNTWDLFMNFFNLASDVAGLFFCLPKFLFVCKFTFVAGTFLNLLYIVLVHFNVKNLEEKRQA